MSVKYLPPNSTGVVVASAAPIPIYNLSPVFDWVPANDEYPNSPIASVPVVIALVLVLLILIFELAI
jgi:hypothetical protein